MEPIRKALGLLVLAAFLVLMAAPVFAHSGNSDPVAPNTTGITVDEDLIALGIVQDHDTRNQ
jgi:type IV secretory pathway VirB2 component (pilin)